MSRPTEDNRGIIEKLASHKRLIVVVIAVIYSIIIILPRFLNKQYGLEKAYYISQILVGVFVIGGTVIALLQYISSYYQHKENKRNETKVEAAKLANMFVQEVIPEINKLTELYSLANLNDEIIKFLYKKDLENFDCEEVKRIFSDVDKYMSRLASAYMEKYESDQLDIISQKYKDNKGKNTHEYMIILLDCIPKVSWMCSSLGNTLEYFAICFNSGVADDETVYQSLHEIFFNAVHMIYIFCFITNVQECDRKYYNISELYKRWMDKYKQLSKQELEEERAAKKDLVERKKKIPVKSN